MANRELIFLIKHTSFDEIECHKSEKEGGSRKRLYLNEGKTLALKMRMPHNTSGQ